MGARFVIAGNLFTRDYLLEGVTFSESWTALDDSKVTALKAGFLKHLQRFRAISKANEAQTEKTLIYPVLELLGWTDVEVQQTLSSKGRKQVPDALLFANAQSRDHSVAEPDQWKRFQYGLAVLEAKRWERSLDRASKGDEGVPATQMLQYLSRVDVQTSGKVRLGILTNGRIWRLYWQGALSVAEDFFEIDLAKALEVPGCELDLLDRADPRITPDHCLKLFILLLGKSAFLPLDGQRTFHDISRDAGKTWEERVTKDLSRLVFGELFPSLVTAIAASDPKRPSVIERPYLAQVRQSALVLLYRLLFVVYAEDRDLLPSNREPYKDFSLTAMRLDIAKRRSEGKIFSETMITYWPKLTAIFKAISDGDNTFGIPPYNGGLFAKEGAPLLSDIQLPDAVLTGVIYGLSHRIEDGRPRYINYRDLSVQQLGSVYEKTLEYDLKVTQDGKVIADADDTARHESGSYYTADSLVMLIIEKAVGPLVEERLATFRVETEKLASDRRSKDTRVAHLTSVDPAKAILNLKICDPAMGSGHFLVSLVDWLADKVLAAMADAEQTVTWADNAYQSPLANEISTIRHEIIRHASENKWPFVDEHLQDRHIVRRMVLKRCVYGVDKNPLAVELAKVALWLHTFTVGAPLSFLDHHLRCGDSLFGAWVRPAMDRLIEWGSPLLMDAPRKRALGAAAGMQTIEKLTDADIAEVYQSKNLFDGIESMTSELTGLLNLVHAIEWQQPSTRLHKATIQEWTKGTFGDPVKVATGGATFEVPPPPKLTEMEIEKRKLQKIASFNTHDTASTLKAWLPDIKTKFENEHFLHWQVAFPGIWRNWESAELNGGFDAVIGNPPYVRQELLKPVKPALQRYFTTYSGQADLYVYFYEQGLKLLKPGGRLSYVVTNKWMRADYAEKLREFFAAESWVEFVADFGHAKKFFPDADVFPSVLVVRKPAAGAPLTNTQVCVIPRDDVPEKGLYEAVTKATYSLPRVHFAKDNWTLEPPAVVALLDKIRRNGIGLKSGMGVEPYYGIKTGLNEAFLINAETRDRLVSEHPQAAQHIRPYLRGQDVQRWASPETGLFMIVMKSSENYAWPWSNASDETEAEQCFQANYPSLHRHLKSFEEFVDPKTQKLRGLRHREDQGRFWWELRSCAYYNAFERPKILYVDITWTPSFLVDTIGRFTNNTCYFLPTVAPMVVASLNAPVGWWYSWRKAQHGKDEALRYFTSFMEDYPVAQLTQTQQDDVSKDILRLAHLVEASHIAQRRVSDWLAVEFGLDKPKGRLLTATTLDAEGFTSAVRASVPKRRKLTASEIAELKREHSVTIEPARHARGEIFTLELGLSDLVNEAYGLTPEEKQLMWRTAPPRMPFTPAGLTTEIMEVAADNGYIKDADA
jgi:hypothetical protein